MDGMFDTVFDRVFGHEGGYSDNPKDPGNWTGGKEGDGELLGTKYGIAANTYPGINIKELTEAQARAIYFEDWWCALEMQRFSKVMQFQMFDAAFNHGMRNASKMFQRAVKTPDDGIIGPKTMKAAQEMDDNDKVIRFLSYRLRFFADLGAFDTFGRGWSRRIADNLLYAAEDN